MSKRRGPNAIGAQQAPGKVIDLMAALKASLHPDKVCVGCGHVHTPNVCVVPVLVRGGQLETCGCANTDLSTPRAEGR